MRSFAFILDMSIRRQTFCLSKNSLHSSNTALTWHGNLKLNCLQNQHKVKTQLTYIIHQFTNSNKVKIQVLNQLRKISFLSPNCISSLPHPLKQPQQREKKENCTNNIIKIKKLNNKSLVANYWSHTPNYKIKIVAFVSRS